MLLGLFQATTYLLFSFFKNISCDVIDFVTNPVIRKYTTCLMRRSDGFHECPDEVRSKRKGFLTATSESVGRNSSVGITTRYGLDAPEIECRFGRDFRIRPDRPWRPSSLLHSGYRVSFLGVKRPGRGVGHPPTSSVEVKERVVLYLYTPSPPLGRKCLF